MVKLTLKDWTSITLTSVFAAAIGSGLFYGGMSAIAAHKTVELSAQENHLGLE
ncbi:MAG: hypothetical protein AAGB32_05295 [Pseudomonadota bacterium]